MCCSNDRVGVEWTVEKTSTPVFYPPFNGVREGRGVTTYPAAQGYSSRNGDCPWGQEPGGSLTVSAADPWRRDAPDGVAPAAPGLPLSHAGAGLWATACSLRSPS
jgi:hypothetical protein